MKNSFKLKLINGQFEDIKSQSLGRPKLTFLDPPDNEGRKYENYNDKLPTNEYVHLLRKWIQKACKITDGPVFVSVAEKWMNEVESLIWHGSILLIRRLYWHYTFGQNLKKSYCPCIRPIYWLNNPIIFPENILVPSARQEKYGDKRAREGGKMPENMWAFPRICGTFKERRKFHPTQHPEALMTRIILGHSQPGDVVLDPFIGSGTTALVCQATERNCIGIDKSKYYLNMVAKEIKLRKKLDKH